MGEIDLTKMRNADGRASSAPLVLLGVTGCIAAYKSCEILRGLQKAGVRVKVVMTEHGTHFVDPVTFRALTHEKVAVGLFDDPSDPIHHISLAQECDVFLIAPCTANVMAKVACGIADDLLSTTALATTATLAIAPAANVHMYEAAATQENMATLRRRGVRFIEGGAGYLACGDVGRGRLADPAVIVRETLGLLAERVGLDALRGAGIQAMEAFPEKQAMAYSGVVAAVGVGAASGKTAGFCHYLGEMKDPETQAVRERYGKELFGQITVELRANRAADCERGCETATEVLLGGLPEGVRTGELTWEAICWEKTTGMFLRRGVLECRALFLAESAVESGEFLDFRLKGVMSE